MSDSVKVLLSVCEKLANKHNLKAELVDSKFRPPVKSFGKLFILFGAGFVARRFALLPGRFGFAVPVIGFIGYNIIKTLSQNRHKVLPALRIKAIEDVLKVLSTSQKIELASIVGSIIKKHTSITALDETAILEALDPVTELLIINEIVQILRERLNLDVCLSL